MSYSKEILEMLDGYYSNEANKYLIEKSKRETFFDIINKSRKEDVHSNFLKWIFGLKNLPCAEEFYPIQELIRIILRRALSQSKSAFIDNEILHHMSTGAMSVRVKSVDHEVKCPGVKYWVIKEWNSERCNFFKSEVNAKYPYLNII